MSNKMLCAFSIVWLVGIGVGYCIGFIYGGKDAVNFYTPLVERYKVQVDTLLGGNGKLIASHQECRTVLRQVLETFDYIQPRPITIED